ncbi:MAG TPA: hypothetical protein DCW35_02215 [Polynucleobacter sp.]|nr:hypothetical protein [Polynucleobacter sp.]
MDISWKLQLRHWEVRFEPAATCWILMSETLKGLWSQRLRWATNWWRSSDCEILSYLGKLEKPQNVVNLF